MAFPLDMATDDFSPPPRTGIEPNGNVVVDSYRQDIMNGFEQAAPAYNSMNPGRPQSSVMVDLKDPIQIHLLTETALSDSKEFEILSQEEIDGLKKLVQTLTKRIESTRSNLLIQAKYRDAANSMAKLYNPSNGEDPDQAHSMREAEEERRVTQQRCEDLAAELFYLEKQLMEPKSRLLEHTAGILQLTHKASKKKATANGQPLNGVPGSPESLYTYTQGRDSLYGPDGFYTDDTSFEEFERGNAKGLNNPLEIPMKSPIREQQSQLKEDLDRSREENTYLMGSISDMEKRLEDLNSSLRDTIIRFNPEHNAEFLPPPRSAAPNGSDPSEFLREQFDYLETALEAIEAEQQTLLDELHGNENIGSSNVDATLTELWDMIHNGYTDIRKRQEDRRRARADKGLEDDEEISDDEGIDLSESYTLFGFSSRVRWLYRQATVLKDQKSVLKRQIKQQRELNNKSDAEKDAELAQKQEELDQSHIIISRAEKDAMDAQQMLSEALEDLEQARDASRGAGDAHAELHERAARTEALEAKLKELQQILAESEADSQATQQRLAQVDSSITTLSEALDDATETAAQSHAKSEHLQEELRQKQEEIAKAQQMVAQAQQEIAQAQEEARQAQEEAEEAQEEAERVQEEAEKAHEEVEKAQKEAEQAYNEAKQAQEEVKHKEEEIKQKNKALKEKEEEFDTLNMSYVELKTEVTIARAELDGAYGTRAERAADVAAIRVNGEINKLENQVQKLKSELAETVKELEEVTKETIGSEREKTELEGKLDEAISAKMSLETDLSNLRERLDVEVQKSTDKLAQLQDELDGERLKASRGDASARPGIGASMLSEKFRATMREERKKFQEDIKDERAKNRKLEEELSKLKRAQGPGKSPLSPQ
ncbi:unnamed protein product [Clonostachys solani]|uniref:Up-regulated during septation protein 1 domain-containing protein n=1 Tax=Clonostachys solani TaxID=160281 RepID=A0A9N9VYX5_9HYPO|nr:unnamed protein product [Clonostachys solani]